MNAVVDAGGRRPDAGTRSHLRAVGVPSEHGGWGLTVEPIILGLLMAPSVAGVFVGLVGFMGFLLRTPFKFALVDAGRHRVLGRTLVARRLAAAEFFVSGALFSVALSLSPRPFWLPLLAAVPLLAVQMSFDMRSRSRRLVPELAGSVGVCSLAAAVALAGGARTDVAIGAWLVLSARALTSIPFVRGQVALLHGRVVPSRPLLAWDAAAVVFSVVAVSCDRSLLVGSLGVVAVVLAQRLSAVRPAPRAAVVGIRQMVFGGVLVVMTWLGVLMNGGAL